MWKQKFRRIGMELAGIVLWLHGQIVTNGWPSLTDYFLSLHVLDIGMSEPEASLKPETLGSKYGSETDNFSLASPLAVALIARTALIATLVTISLAALVVAALLS